MTYAELIKAVKALLKQLKPLKGSQPDVENDIDSLGPIISFKQCVGPLEDGEEFMCGDLQCCSDDWLWLDNRVNGTDKDWSAQATGEVLEILKQVKTLVETPVTGRK